MTTCRTRAEPVSTSFAASGPRAPESPDVTPAAYLEQRVDERSQRRALDEDDGGTDDDEHNDDRRQPPGAILPEEEHELANEPAHDAKPSHYAVLFNQKKMNVRLHWIDRAPPVNCLPRRQTT